MRQERIKLGWPQEFVAQRIGVTPETIHHIETGKRKPSFSVLVKLEDLFGMDYRELFNLPERQPRYRKSPTAIGHVYTKIIAYKNRIVQSKRPTGRRREIAYPS